MKQTVINWTIFALAALVAGPIAGRLVEMSQAADGARAATALISASPVMGIILYGAAFVIAGLVGVAAARVAPLGVAMPAAGLVLAWVAWRTARIDDVLRLTHESGSFWTLAIEGLLMAGAGIAIGAFILRASRRLKAEPGDGLFSGQTLAGAGAGMAAGAMAAWLIARSDEVGQTFAAAIAAGVAVTVVGRIVSVRAPLLAFVAVGSLLAFAGPAAGGIANGAEAVRDAYAGTLIPLARVMPIDWIAGILIGVPIGASWAAAMVHKHAPAA